MTLDEAIGCLSKIGVDVSKATLNRYVREGLVTAPERGGYGRGGGRWANYSISAVAEAATAWAMLTKKTQTDEFFKELQYLRCTPEMVALARKGAMHAFYDADLPELRKYCPNEFIEELVECDAVKKADSELEKVCLALENGRENLSFDEWRELMDKQTELENKSRVAWQNSTVYPSSRLRWHKDEEKRLIPLLGNITIPDFFPLDSWASSAGSIDMFVECALLRLYVKIYGAMLLKVLNLIDKK